MSELSKQLKGYTTLIIASKYEKHAGYSFISRNGWEKVSCAVPFRHVHPYIADLFIAEGKELIQHYTKKESQSYILTVKKTNPKDPSEPIRVNANSYDIYSFESGICFFCATFEHQELQSCANLSEKTKMLTNSFFRAFIEKTEEISLNLKSVKFQDMLLNTFNECARTPVELDNFFYFQKGKYANMKAHFFNICFDLLDQDTPEVIDEKLFFLSKTTLHDTNYIPSFSKGIAKQQYDNNRIFGISSDGVGVLCKSDEDDSQKSYFNSLKDNYFFLYLFALHERFLVLLRLSLLHQIDYTKYNVNKLTRLHRDLIIDKTNYFYNSISPNYYHQEYYAASIDKLQIGLFLSEFNEETTSLKNQQLAISQRNTKMVLHIISVIQTFSVVNLIYNFYVDFTGIKENIIPIKSGLIIALIALLFVQRHYSKKV